MDIIFKGKLLTVDDLAEKLRQLSLAGHGKLPITVSDEVLGLMPATTVLIDPDTVYVDGEHAAHSSVYIGR